MTTGSTCRRPNTIGAAIVNYAMSFHRNGSYDDYDDPALDPLPYEGDPYPVIENDPSPPLGIGPYQPVPVIAITSDLGGRVPGLSVGAGLYAPNAAALHGSSGVVVDFSKPRMAAGGSAR